MTALLAGLARIPILAEPALGRRIAIALLLVAGVALRIGHMGEHGSDVLAVTRAAIGDVAAGVNPYGHGYAQSSPPGAPFAYGPMALLYYAVTPERIELIASVAVLVVLALANRLIGLAGIALWLPLSILASDGSNDTSVGLLLLGALVLAERRPALGAAALAGVVAFKPYALAFLPPLLAWGGWSLALPFGLASLAAWGPAVVAWGPGPMAWSFQTAMEVHRQPWYSLGAAIDATAAGRRILPFVQLASGAATTLFALIGARSARAVAGWGTLIFAATLFTGWWASVAYWAAVVPALAWHVDAWFGDVTTAAWHLGNGSRSGSERRARPATA